MFLCFRHPIRIDRFGRRFLSSGLGAARSPTSLGCFSFRTQQCDPCDILGIDRRGRLREGPHWTDIVLGRETNLPSNIVEVNDHVASWRCCHRRRILHCPEIRNQECAVYWLPLMAPEFTIVLVPSPRQSARERELQASTVRSHAARVSSAQAAVTKWSKRTAVSNARADQRARAKQQLQAKAAASTPPLAATPPETDDESSISISLASPIMILGQGQVDPFTNDGLSNLPPIARNSLEYMMEVIWRTNSPGLSRATLTNHIAHCKMLAVHSPLQFHTQISSAVSLCYALSNSPEVLKTLLATRLKHQTAALSILRDSIANLTGPPSDELIDCLSRLAAQGGDLARPGFVSRYRQTPIVDSLPIRLYGCFEPCIPHFQALSFLIRQRGSLEVIAPAISHHLSLYVVWRRESKSSANPSTEPTRCSQRSLELVLPFRCIKICGAPLTIVNSPSTPRLLSFASIWEVGGKYWPKATLRS
jgi:hypothetical protein